VAATLLQLPQAGGVTVRDNAWLSEQLDHIWSTWFSDVAPITPVSIRFVRPWKTRLAVIYLSDNETRSFIGVNRYLRDSRVPYPICLVTIAHELTHYAHGFGSHHRRRYRHPHRGNVVQRELRKRGLGAELRFYTDWTNDVWYDILPDLQRNDRPMVPAALPALLEEQAAARVL
jgi:hypothetical protein